MYAALRSLLIFILLTLICCDKPYCENTNPIFTANIPDSPAYQRELAKQLKARDRDDIDYWLEGYLEDEGKTYLLIAIVDSGLCAKSRMLVNHWDENIIGIKRAKGISYGGEIIGLEYKIEKDGTLVYKSLDWIVD